MLKRRFTVLAISAFLLITAGCSQQSTETSQESSRKNTVVTTAAITEESADTASKSSASEEESSSSADTAESSASASSSEGSGEDEVFSKRDLNQTPDTSDAKTITLSDNSTKTITEEGIYILTGSASECTVKVEAAKEAKVQLILDGITVTNTSTPVIYVVSADKCFVTTTDKESTLSVKGEFTADGETNTDAVIFSKDDLVLNGTGTLNITSSANAISGKDDIKATGGTYNLKCTNDGIEANESISICAGTYNIEASKKGIQSSNDEDTSTGTILITGGTFNITAGTDSIQGTTLVQIDGGTLTLNSSEGIESTYVKINGGTIDITASDDGINAAAKSSAYSTPTIEINDGKLTIVMGQGDTDAIDANGDIYVNGGTIDITAQVSSFDYDGKAEYNGGTIIINGSQVDSIPQSMMGDPGMGGMGRH